MGTFMGHALPGSFFITFSFWWIIQIWCRYFRCRKANVEFRSTFTYTSSCLPGRLKQFEIEGCLKIIFSGIGISGEIITGISHGYFYHTGNIQHATMFFFFGMSGVIDILVHYNVTTLPKNTQYVITAISFSVEGLMFKFHLHINDEFEALLHTLLLYAIAGCVISCFIEMYYRDSLLATLARPCFVLLQGTWFYQIAFVMYSPIPGVTSLWKHDSHNDMMLQTVIFTWHAGFIFIFMLLTGCFSKCCTKMTTCGSYDDLAMQSLLGHGHGSHNGHKILRMDASDFESDTEITK